MGDVCKKAASMSFAWHTGDVVLSVAFLLPGECGAGYNRFDVLVVPHMGLTTTYIMSIFITFADMGCCATRAVACRPQPANGAVSHRLLPAVMIRIVQII